MVAFLGMGLLGQNFVRAMIQKGGQVQVWNRTPAAAKKVEQYGAKVCATAADAVRGASMVHLALKDDATVNSVLEAARPGLAPGTLIIDHTTTSAAGAVERTREWKAKGFTFLHAPVFMGPINALESTGFMLVSGDQELIARVQPDLVKMTGKLLNFGPEPGRAAAMKLIGNLFLEAFTLGISDALVLAKAQGVPLADVSELFGSWNPATMITGRLKRMTSGKYDDASWKLHMARKDAQLMIDAADGAGQHLAVIPAIAAEMDRWIEKGHAEDDWTVVAKGAL